MPRIIFNNQSGARAQVCVQTLQTTTNLQIFDGDSDDATVANKGETVTFWWRNDGNLCQPCADPNSPCAMQRFTMPGTDMTIRLGDGTWPKQTK